MSDAVLDALEVSSLDIDGFKRRGEALLARAAKIGKRVSRQVLDQQEAIADILRRVRFDGLDAKRAKRNMSYRRRQVAVIFERAKNKIAIELAEEYNEMAGDILAAVVLVVKGIIF